MQRKCRANVLVLSECRATEERYTIAERMQDECRESTERILSECKVDAKQMPSKCRAVERLQTMGSRCDCPREVSQRMLSASTTATFSSERCGRPGSLKDSLALHEN